MGKKWDYMEMKGFVGNLIGSFPFHKSHSALKSLLEEWTLLKLQKSRTHVENQFLKTKPNLHTHTHFSTHNAIQLLQGPDYPDGNS